MKAKKITIRAEISVARPVKDVFRAVLLPVPFFLKRAGGPMKAGQEIEWEFPEFPEAFPVYVKKVESGKLIRFQWARDQEGGLNTVEFRFKPFTKKITTVYVSETGWPDDETGRASSVQNCMGWTHMICSLKAWLEHKVNLRENAFVHMKF